jgi:excisionase family DNA binding protein
MSRNDKESQDVQPLPRRILDERWDGRSNFSIAETAQILGLSVWATYEAAKRGDIPAFKVGGRRIVPRHALEKKMLGA